MKQQDNETDELEKRSWFHPTSYPNPIQQERGGRDGGHEGAESL